MCCLNFIRPDLRLPTVSVSSLNCKIKSNGSIDCFLQSCNGTKPSREQKTEARNGPQGATFNKKEMRMERRVPESGVGTKKENAT